MKKIVFFLFLCIVSKGLNAQRVALSSMVDERVELAAVFCRAMGLNFSVGSLEVYDVYERDMTECYQSVNAHRMTDISFALIDMLGFSGDSYKAIMEDALYWEIEDGGVRCSVADGVRPPLRRLLSEDEYGTFLGLVDRFYRLTSFENFFRSHSGLYRQAEQLYDSLVLERYRPEVFESLYGVDHGGVNIYVSLANGSMSYSVSDRRAVVMGGFCGLTMGPYYEDMGLHLSELMGDRLYLFLQEMSEMFLNDAVEPMEEKVSYYTNNYYRTSMWLLDRNGHSSESLLLSQVASLGVLLYVNGLYGEQDVRSLIGSHRREGFVWQDEMWRFVAERFVPNRNSYLTLQSFLPEFLGYYRVVLNY